MNEIKKEIISLIEEIPPYDELEKQHKDDALEWIKSGIEIFRIEKPATPLKHLVCYMALCDFQQKKILLLEHKISELLLTPGGHVDKDELIYDTAKREIKEELEIEAEFAFDNWKVPFFISQVETVGKTAGHFDVDVWYILKGDCEKPLNDQGEEFKREFGDYNWYTFDEILEMPIENFDPNMHRFVNKLKSL